MHMLFSFNFPITAGTNRNHWETSLFSLNIYLKLAKSQYLLAIEKKLQLSSAENLALQEIK